MYWSWGGYSGILLRGGGVGGRKWQLRTFLGYNFSGGLFLGVKILAGVFFIWEWERGGGGGVSKPVNTLATMGLFLMIACTGRRDERRLYL